MLPPCSHGWRMPGVAARHPLRKCRIHIQIQEGNPMKQHVLSGTAIAAALASVAVLPLAANAVPTGPSIPAVSSPRGVELVVGPSGNADQHTSAARKARHHHGARHPVARHGRPSESMANQLNAQESASHSGGGMSAPAMGAPGSPRNQYGQPNQVYGIPGAGQPSAGTPVPGQR